MATRAERIQRQIPLKIGLCDWHALAKVRSGIEIQAEGCGTMFLNIEARGSVAMMDAAAGPFGCSSAVSCLNYFSYLYAGGSDAPGTVV